MQDAEPGTQQDPGRQIRWIWPWSSWALQAMVPFIMLALVARPVVPLILPPAMGVSGPSKSFKIIGRACRSATLTQIGTELVSKIALLV